MTGGMLPVLFFVVVCGTSLVSPSASSSAEQDREGAAGDRKEEPPSDVQLLVPMVMVDEGNPSQGRSGINQRPDSASSEKEERPDTSLNKLAQLLSRFQPQHISEVTPLTPRPRFLPTHPTNPLNDDEECPACFVLHALQAMEEDMEKRNNVGQWNSRAGKPESNLDQISSLIQFKKWKNPETAESFLQRWDQKGKLLNEKGQRLEQKLKLLEQKSQRWDQKGKLWNEKGQRLEQKLKQMSQRWDQKAKLLDQKSKIWIQKSEPWDKKDQHLDLKEQVGRGASQRCTLCLFDFGTMNRRAGDAPDAGPAPDLPAPQGKGPTP